ncbi:LuxR C-terminal-related transcriptional regulator [Streptomyces sp. x-80]|uniref:helix-turn-helix transcriptional regulator n=1 Tax=Streptomyces sp. x-80 TaxID=2789282 RepID=UPI0039809F02
MSGVIDHAHDEAGLAVPDSWRSEGMDNVDSMEREQVVALGAWPGMLAHGSTDAAPVVVLPYLGVVQWWSGRPKQALVTLRRGRRAAEGLGAEFVALHCRVRELEIGRVMDGADRTEEEARSVRELIETRGWGDRYPLNLIHLSAGWCAWQRDELVAARRHLGRVTRVAGEFAPPERAELALLEAEVLISEDDPVAAGDVLNRVLARPQKDLPYMVRARLAATRCRAGRAAGMNAVAVESTEGVEDGRRDFAFTGRELEILRLLPAPMTVSEIAWREHVSVNTVKTQLKSIYRKLEADNRRSAVRLARRYGVL